MYLSNDQASNIHDHRRAYATETQFSETRNVTDVHKQQKSNTPWAVSRWHTELMDEQTNKSETDQSDIRRPNVLLQDHQWQSTSPMIKQIILMTTDEHVPLRPTFQKLEMFVQPISNISLTHPGKSLSGTQN